MKKNNFIVTEDLYADKGKRLANYVVDRILFYITTIALVMLFTVILIVIGGDAEQLAYELENINRFTDILITAVITLFLYFFSEILLKGRTIGKYVTKTKVVTYTGEVPDVGAIFTRSLCRFIPFEAFSFLGQTGRGWHDSISDTYVVDIEKFNARMKANEELDQIGTSTEI